MGFELNISDMERHAVELRLFMDKAKRRFEKAQKQSDFEKIVKNILAQAQTEPTEQNTLKIDNVNQDTASALSNFLNHQIEKCSSPDQFEALQGALRASLHQVRRKSITDSSTGTLMEQICYFCAGTPADETHKHVNHAFDLQQALDQLSVLQQQVTPAPTEHEQTPPQMNPNASEYVEVVMGEDRANNGPEEEAAAEPEAEAEAEEKTIPPSPEEEEEATQGALVMDLDEAREDSMHAWFETTNNNVTVPRRASTPISSKSNNEMKIDKEHLYCRVSDIKFKHNNSSGIQIQNSTMREVQAPANETTLQTSTNSTLSQQRKPIVKMKPKRKGLRENSKRLRNFGSNKA